MSNITGQSTRARTPKGGSQRNPIPEADAVAALSERLGLAPVESVDALTDLIVGEWSHVPGFREKVRFAVGTNMTQYRTGQQSLTAAAKGVAYAVKSIREWYSKEGA